MVWTRIVFLFLLCIGEASLFSMDLPEEKGMSLAMPPKVARLQSAIDVIGQSAFMNAFTGFLAVFQKIPEERVSPEIEEMWEEAQKNNPSGRKVPLRYEKVDGALAVANLNHVTLSRSDVSIGVLRYALRHENEHMKGNDRATSAAIAVLTPFVLTSPLYKVNFQSDFFKFAAIGGTSTLMSLVLMDYFLAPYYERRADIKGAYATQCFVCIDECVHFTTEEKVKQYEKISFIDEHGTPGSKNNKKIKKDCQKFLSDRAGGNSPYLSPKELKSIARDLKRQGLICNHHKEK